MFLNQELANKELLALTELADVWQQQDFSLLPHQLEAADKVINELEGRALLADEVGLGKTIEAGLILKEYILRGEIDNFLVLTPASLSYQWWTELKGKFNLDVFNNRKGKGWHYFDYQIASLDRAKREPHANFIKERNFDMIVVDEAHRLKNKETQNWQFVKELKPRYLLLLTATPVQNNLKEFYNLIDLLKPDLASDYRSFKSDFIKEAQAGSDDYELGAPVAELMIRNTRKEIELEYSNRQVELLPIELSDLERKVYTEFSELMKRGQEGSLHLVTLQREFCSSPWALIETLKELTNKVGAKLSSELKKVMDLAAEIEINSKLKMLNKIVQQLDGQAVIFTKYLATQHYICHYLYQQGIMPLNFDGTLSDNQKEWTKQLFANQQGDVLVSTEAGKQGINLQFCNVVINYDLPWNPMKLEQRIGRVHRLGQDKEVQIYNFITRETVEERVLELLVQKIDLFESVVGDLNSIIEQS
ncbi:DEAD/DEAH box helicase [Fuchsiella alkaliacetigena]|uniref:DEAD/DEAH box helicase n=1 Tax=Fuchsiella alkaliacetigena TaxID=957042 RepID=UPI00200B23B2|nr:SNF2-related protein [Fuchsiella alkaliacetigena]MCK8823468.1 DEAD/DEAH box helicase [Fuchsiella alkaliacetigena]